MHIHSGTHTHLSTHHWASHFLFLSPMFPLRVLWQLSSSRMSLRVAHLFFCVVGYWWLNGRQGHGVFVKMVPRGYTDKTNDGETKSQHQFPARGVIASQRSNLKQGHSPAVVGPFMFVHVQSCCILLHAQTGLQWWSGSVSSECRKSFTQQWGLEIMAEVLFTLK